MIMNMVERYAKSFLIANGDVDSRSAPTDR